MDIIIIISLWLFSYIVYYLNPMNDVSRADSRYNYYSFESAEIRRQLNEMLESKGKYDVNLEWPSVRPFIYPSLIVLLYIFFGKSF